MKKTCEKSGQPVNLKEGLRSPRFRKIVAGVIVGGLLGYLYYYYVGCTSGSCAITSNPYMSMLFGSALGFYIINSPCSKC